MSPMLQRIPRWLAWWAIWCLAALALGGCTDPALAGLPAQPVPPAPYFSTRTPRPTFPPTPWAQASTPTPLPTPRPIRLDGPLTLAVAPELPEELSIPLLDRLNQIEQVQAANGAFPLRLLDQAENAATTIELLALRAAEHRLAERFYAVVAPFATIPDDITLEALQLRWQSGEGGPLFAAAGATRMLAPVLGAAGPVEELPTDELLARLEATPGALAIIPFDQLHPRFKALTVDGANVLSNRLVPEEYPLAVALAVRGEGAELLADALYGLIDPATNRDASRLTTLIMTGVTAMSRGTAAAMEQYGYTYPAEIISGTLSAADITHVSNEVPFLDDCVVNNTLNNLVLCSHTDYWATLEAIGTDIVGLSGNHVNDFGRDGARESLQWYRDHGIPIYGSGLTVDEACAPLRWEHNGNTFAFIAALAFGPETAWVTDEEPGACYYYEHQERVLAMVEELAAEVDIVSVELQYLEEYTPWPTAQQVIEFRELRDAGADIVTGVQSHVPQAMEPYGANDPGGPGIIAYGLGNLFFDQMWSWETRTELMARHTIYDGRVINTEILTAVLENYAQPRWTTPDERAEILNRIFAAAPPRPE
ncbi:MAG TPA: CapA family protein [Caldilineaceae bacterium]|nr:CapA family protein [Caldilineaceae bacterium]